MMRKVLFATAIALAIVSAPACALDRDGQHDFDFLTGTWKIHLKRLVSDRWVEFDGVGLYRPIWNGRANVNEFEAEGPDGHIEGLTLRTYDPHTHLWSLYRANSGTGILEPAQIGRFTDGQGEFYAQDKIDGRPVFVRYVWSKITATSAHFEQSLSEDGGKTWKANWISDMAKERDGAFAAPPNTSAAADEDGQHGFDGLIGHWNFHLHRLNERLVGSTQWTDFYGAGDCIPLWNGRANMDTLVVDSPTGKIEGLTLRLFDPKLKLWRLYWANSKDGLVDVPQLGQFHQGHGEFYAQDIQNDHAVLIRYDWTNLTGKAPHFEQAFSIDGGKSWEVNWITDQTRVEESKN
jgi:hypothetical protein